MSKLTLKVCLGFILQMAFSNALHAQLAPNFQYVPGQQDVPLLYRADQARVTLSVGASFNLFEFLEGPVFGGELRGAYALTDRFGVLGGGYAYRLDRVYTSTIYGGASLITQEYRHQGRWDHWELGAGTFKLMANNWIGELYGLVGWGGVRNEFPDGYWLSSRMRSFSVQPIIGRASGFLEYAFSSRFRFFHLDHFEASTVPPGDFREFDTILAGQGPFLMWEPSLTIRGAWKRTRIVFQVGFSGDMYRTTPTRSDLTLGLGLCLWFPGRAMDSEWHTGE